MAASSPPTLAQLLARYFPGATGTTLTRGETWGSETEQGIDISAPANTPVRLPVAATYSAANSTAYQSVFTLPSGGALSFTHINALPLSDGVKLAAGSVIGTVTGLTGSYSSRGRTYTSSGPHVEFGVYDSPSDAFNWAYTGTRDPVSWLEGVAMHGGAAPSAPTGANVPPVVGPGGITDPSSYISGNLPNVGHYVLIAGLALALIGVVIVLLVRLGDKTGLTKVAAVAA